MAQWTRVYTAERQEEELPKDQETAQQSESEEKDECMRAPSAGAVDSEEASDRGKGSARVCYRCEYCGKGPEGSVFPVPGKGSGPKGKYVQLRPVTKGKYVQRPVP